MNILLVLTALLSIAASVPATQVQFPPGKSSTTIHDAIARGETHRYLLNARKGQVMKLSINSVEGNAVFSVLSDGGQISKDEETRWQATLPSTGTYAIQVGSTRGGADFQLQVEIH